MFSDIFKSRYLGILPFFLSTSFVFAQSSGVGGGGNALICTRGSQTTVELADLWEGTNGIQRLTLNGDWQSLDEDTILDRVAHRLADLYFGLQPDFRNDSRELRELNQINNTELYRSIRDGLLLTRGRMHPMDVELAEHRDATFRVELPSECHLYQLAFYRNSLRDIGVSSRIQNQMSPLHRAATVVHEWLYALWRANSNSNGPDLSNEIRPFVALIFSNANGLSDAPRWREFMMRIIQPHTFLANGRRFYVFAGISGRADDQEQIANSTFIRHLRERTADCRGAYSGQYENERPWCGIQLGRSTAFGSDSRNDQRSRFEIVDIHERRRGTARSVPRYPSVVINDLQNHRLWVLESTQIAYNNPTNMESFRTLESCGGTHIIAEMAGRAGARHATTDEIRRFRRDMRASLNQFDIADSRSLPFEVRELLEHSIIPSEGTSLVREDSSDRVWNRGIYDFRTERTVLTVRRDQDNSAVNLQCNGNYPVSPFSGSQCTSVIQIAASYCVIDL